MSDGILSGWQRHSGPAVARAYHATLAIITMIAWVSLGGQVRVLIGARGLSPIGDVLEQVSGRDLGLLDFPSLLRWWPAGDGWLVGGCWLGGALGLLALLGVLPRVACLLNAVLYLSYTVACGTFLSFQWDNLLIECLLVGALLPRDRPSPPAHLMARLLLFKIFFESALAKAGSPLHDWWDGSAMTCYYETAPIPTRLAWYAHHLPAWWHAFEGWWTLFFEGVLVFGILGPRPTRLVALAAFVGFLVLDTATANYGFFTHLTGALCLFLLDERDVERAATRLRGRLPWWPRWSGFSLPNPPPERARAAGLGALVAGWFALSLAGGVGEFTDAHPLQDAVELGQRLRFCNIYHLFASITRERIEPEFQVQDGGAWVALDLRYKPGDPLRPPPFVAPHQPRVDFRLWFYGLSFERGAPGFVRVLLDRLCHDPEAVEPLFVHAVPRGAEAVRIVFWQYHFTTPEQRAASGAWWSREEVGHSKIIPCR